MAALPALSGLTSLQMLDLSSCSALTALPELESLPALQTLDLGGGCRKLKALPDLSNLGSLTALDLGGCSSLEVVALRSPPLGRIFKQVGCRRRSRALRRRPGCGRCTLDAAQSSRCHVTGLATCRPCPTVPPGLQALPGLNALQSLQTFELGGCWGLKVYSGDTWEPLLPHEIDGGVPSRRARPHRCIKPRHSPTWHRSVRFTRSTWKTALRSKVCPTSRRCRCCNPSRFAYRSSSTNASDTVTIKLGEYQ